jgi:hypothetical protein
MRRNRRRDKSAGCPACECARSLNCRRHALISWRSPRAIGFESHVARDSVFVSDNLRGAEPVNKIIYLSAQTQARAYSSRLALILLAPVSGQSSRVSAACPKFYCPLYARWGRVERQP